MCSANNLAEKKFQFETLFCHVTTYEILHMNYVFGLR